MANRTGGNIYIIGAEFVSYVARTPELRVQLDDRRRAFQTMVADAADALAPGERKTVKMSWRGITSTMTGYRWGAFGTIHHNVFVTAEIEKRCNGLYRYIAKPRARIFGYDTYHSFATTPEPYRSLWRWGNDIAGGFSGPTQPYSIYWDWTEDW